MSHPTGTDRAPDTTSGASTSTPPLRARRLPLLIAAVLVWALVLAGLALLPTLTARFGGQTERTTPLVSLELDEKGTYEWTGEGSGIVHLTYVARATDAPQITTTVSAGHGVGSKPLTATDSETLTLTPGEPVTRKVAIPVTCTERTRVGVRTEAPGVTPSEVFTWVIPTKNEKGDPTCSLI